MKNNGMKRIAHCCAIGLFMTTAAFAAVEEPEGITDRKTQACPLNSGGPSLLGSNWRVASTYGNPLQKEVNINMSISLDTLSGNTGCNKYAAKFSQVGATGFKISQIDRTRKPCEIIRPGEGKPTIHLGNIEGSYLRIIRRMGSVQQVDADTLVFYDRNGKEGLTMTKI